MAMHNRDIMLKARERLHGNWGPSVGVSIIYVVICLLVGFVPNYIGIGKTAGSVLGFIVSFIIRGPFSFGITSDNFAMVQGKKVRVGRVFDGFSFFGTSCIAYILMFVFASLWMLLLIVPGIIATIAYSMTFYCLVENPHMGGQKPYDKARQ